MDCFSFLKTLFLLLENAFQADISHIRIGGSKVAAKHPIFSSSATPQTIVNKGIPKDWWQSGSKKRKNIF